MLTNLLIDFKSLIEENLYLVIVLGVIALLIIALLIVMIVLQVKASKLKKAHKAAEKAAEAPAEEAPAEKPEEGKKEEPEPVAPKQEEKAETKNEAPMPEEPAPVKDEPKPETSEEPEEEEKDMKQTDTKPAKERSPYVFKPGKTEEVAPAKASAANGKWVIAKDERGRYGFKLYASNGEVMLESGTPYATLSSAKSGIKTYQDNIAADRLEINSTKNGTYFVQVLNARGGLLATSADYKTRTACTNAAESIKRWAPTTAIEEAPDEE